ncbi:MULTISPECIES: thiamine kinase [unclassified Tatumella]|uniref:thiamine kinase n=1 Tax=unclassified Tatumella TaxID=2649542 RepID=UPI0032C45FC1
MPASLTDPSLLQLVRQYQPAEFSAGCFFPLPGLSGHSVKVILPSATLVARQQPLQPLPFVNRRREYRILKKLSASGLVAAPLGGNSRWLLSAWQPGEVFSPQQFSQQYRQICRTLLHLHRQPLTGYPVSVSVLLEQYWQLCRQRTHHWLKHWQRLQLRGEPAPLRLAPLHMDIHAGNLLSDREGCHFIDWEYAADGDIAIDLAIICLNDPQYEMRWITAYAQAAAVDRQLLQRQVQRWKPWLKLLMACWYQLRAEQTASPQMNTLARQSWQDL